VKKLKKISLIVGLIGVIIFGISVTYWLLTPQCFELTIIKSFNRMIPFILSLTSAGLIGYSYSNK